MRKLLLTAMFALLSVSLVQADKGMWVPTLLSTKMKDMKARGLKLSAEEIFSINEASLKDAVLLFGGGCTGEVISDEGLILTNHHCGYYFIGYHSSVQNDYLTNGFWAMNRSEELPCPGLNVQFLIRMEDVSEQALEGVTDAMSESERAEKIKANSTLLISQATEGTPYTAAVEPFYYGNQYFLFVSEKFTDVRLVGAPPSSIGKFGGDTDNWMWPRHTGDFSMFRIYASPENQPADYAKENVPYTPRRSFEISTKPLKEGDFTMVYGNPGRTAQYVISDAINYTLNRSNPYKIRMRTKHLDIMNAEQAKSPAVRIAYAAKNARIANPWKKWQGESKGLARLGTLDKKLALEERFTAWAADKPAYANVLPELKKVYAELDPYAFARDIYLEAYPAVEMVTFANNVSKFVYDSTASTRIGFFKNYSPVIDFQAAQALLSDYYELVPEAWRPPYFNERVAQLGGVEAFVDELFEKSAFASKESYLELVAQDSAVIAERLKTDPALLMRDAFTSFLAEQIDPQYKALSLELNALYRTYMAGLMEMEPDYPFFPDANLTLRVAYGQIEGYVPFDGAYYTPFTTVDGIIEKDNPEIYDYDIPQSLRDAYARKDYGQWAEEGKVPVAFLASNHTTGGNSGSPVLNARGELIGINFDRTWESTMSDYEFDPIKCRNIVVDIRYVLFVIDKIGGAGYLLDEMTINRK